MMRKRQISLVAESLYESVRNEDGTVVKEDVQEQFEKLGLLRDDPRASELHGYLDQCPQVLKKSDLKACISSNSKVTQKALTNANIIQDFETFSSQMKELYDSCKSNTGGKNSEYIPQLSKQNPDYFGLSVCTIDGQRVQVGDTNVEFSLQSCNKPINYCLALEEHGVEEVHKHVGREPSGTVFNALKLNKQGLPHNPLVNSGAIMMCSLIQQKMKADDRFQYVTSKWKQMSGGRDLGYCNATFLAERMNSDRNCALAYFMKEKKAFPPKGDVLDTLEFYFQCSSLTITCDTLSIIAGTLANGGVCPLTEEVILSPDTVKNCLSMMYCCGLYDYSGEFAFRIGLPGKSSAAGALMIVVPNVMGICTFSPPLDSYGNSVRGVEFFSKLTQKFNFHLFDNIKISSNTKSNPRKPEVGESQEQNNETVIACAANGNLTELLRMYSRGENLFKANFDGRTALHLSASQGHIDVVRYLLDFVDSMDKNVNVMDRWHNTPYDEAIRGNHLDVADYLKSKGGFPANYLKYNDKPFEKQGM